MLAERSLGAVEGLFYRLVTAPQGVAGALSGLGLTADDLVVSDARLDAAGRLEVYANMYFFRLLDVLRGDYPKTLAVLGDAAFHNLVTDYLAAHPPANPSIRFAGDGLPAFLTGHPLCGQRAWLVDLALLEWARVDLFDAVDAVPLCLDDLGQVPPEDFVSLRLQPIPAHRVVQVCFDVAPLWQAIEEGAAPPQDAVPREAALLVWRKGVTVWHRAVSVEEAELLALAARGATFGELCERLGASLTVEEAARSAFAHLARWTSDELLTRALALTTSDPTERNGTVL
ncbi:MAG: putative DNA-binding domain-containing protein [Myxococcales bacterium]|nr:putative DNA-binding domain-containing protein [Myxococcales bacterium]